MDIVKVEACILTIGDEILYGQITDTNSQYISEQLTSLGIRVVQRVSIGDEPETILKSLKTLSSEVSLIITTGGLGPTKDDLTKDVFCTLLNCGLVKHQATLDRVTHFFKARGRDITPLNAKQAEVPSLCKVLDNEIGTAPGMWMEYNHCVMIALPGVPYEMKLLMEQQVLPSLKSYFTLPVIHHKMLYTTGIGESFLADKISVWEDALPSFMKLAYLPSPALVKLRITAFGNDLSYLQSEVNKQVETLKLYIEPYLYGIDEDSKLEGVVGNLLLKEKLQLGLVESCTGGYISHLITSIAGSSQYFKGGLIVYSNALKEKWVQVPAKTLETYGAVSQETTQAMALGGLQALGVDVCLSISGIAGPEGGSEDKPVGTVFVTVAYLGKLYTKKLQLASKRDLNIKLSATHALALLRRVLLGQEQEDVPITIF